jgi:hypothetical protein
MISAPRVEQHSTDLNERQIADALLEEKIDPDRSALRKFLRFENCFDSVTGDSKEICFPWRLWVSHTFRKKRGNGWGTRVYRNRENALAKNSPSLVASCKIPYGFANHFQSSAHNEISGESLPPA